jgi:hypothetical protein
MHKGGRLEMFSAFDRQDVKNIGTWKLVRKMETGQQNLAKHTVRERYVVFSSIILKQLVAKDHGKIHMLLRGIYNILSADLSTFKFAAKYLCFQQTFFWPADDRN